MATTALFGESELTSDGFHSVLDRLAEEYAIRPLSGRPSEGELLLRHDVSLSLADAEMMAEAEADRGIRATYCIMLGSPLFNPLDGVQQRRIRKIESYGHEIGLLFNTHDHWEGEPDGDALAETVSRQQAILGGVVDDPSSIVAFHRPPAWVQQRPFSEFQNALAPEYTGEISYITDYVRARDDPGDHRVNDQSEPVQLLVHPALWMNSASDYERKIERSVIESCRYVNRRARAEFVDPQR